jgi:hypothetical protein
VGNLRALTPGELQLYQGSRTEAADLGALQLARSTAAPHSVVDPGWAPQIFVGDYFAAVRALHSTPADSPAQLLRRPEGMPAAADGVLVRQGEIHLALKRSASFASTAPLVEFHAGGALARHGSCVSFRPHGAGATLDLLLPSGGLGLKTATPQVGYEPPSQVVARRFASGYENAPIATLTSQAKWYLLSAIRDPDALPWHVRISSFRDVTACTLAHT